MKIGLLPADHADLLYDMQILDITTGTGPVSAPEPSALALLSAGLLGIFVFRLRRAQ